MQLDDLGDVKHTAVADFHGVAVENLVELQAWWKVFADEPGELFAAPGLDVSAVRWAEPHDIASPLLFSVGQFSVDLALAEKAYFFGVAVDHQGCIVQLDCLIESNFVIGSVCDPVADGCWDVAQNRRGMVAWFWMVWMAAPLYNAGLKAGYSEKIHFLSEHKVNRKLTNVKQQRNRDVMWFNPPYS